MAFIDAARRFLPQGLSLPEDVWAKRHRAMVILLWFHVPALFTIGVLTNHAVLHVSWEVAIPAAAALIAGLSHSSRAQRMVAVTFGLLTCSALLVHFSGGLIEMHFHFFVMVAAVTLYQAWLPFLFAIAYVVGQHGLVGALDAASVYNHPAAIAGPWKWAVIHGFFILGESVVLLLVWRLNEDARKEMEESYRHLLTEEQAKRDAQDRYRRIFDNALEGIYETTAAGEFLAANPGMARILGYASTEELLESRAQDCYVEIADRDLFLSFLRERGSVSGFRFRARRQDGEIRWLSNHATAVLDDAGAIVAIQGMLEDITAAVEADKERQDLEEQLRHAQKMDAIGQLAGGVAHDFNNLLSVIQNYTDFALEGLASEDRRYEDLQEVKSAGSKGAALVEQLLAFSRKEDVSAATASEPNEAIVEFLKMLGRTLGEDITLETVLEASPWPILIGEGQLEQVLMNLAVNARDAMPGGGRIVFRTSSHEPGSVEHPASLRPDTRYLCITIEDEGSGIAPEIRARHFEPFFTTTDRGRGTGLGLAMVYGIVQQWDGHIAVESEVGVGTRFSLYFPATDVEAPSQLEPITVSTGQGAGRVLVVEDEIQLLRLVCRILSGHGYDPVPAASSAEALEILESTDTAFDVLLTDVIMPGGSGPELSVEARRKYPDLPVIFMSGYANGMLDRHQSEIENNVFLAKPFSADQLVERMRETLELVAL